MIELRTDCSRCQGLCCVAPAFDAAQGFGHDKPAHQACHHLGEDFRCRIHADLAGQGYAGCAVYDCHGAGPQLLALRAPELAWPRLSDAAPVFEAFMAQRRLHEQVLLLRLALPRAGDQREALQALLLRLEQAAAAGQGELAAGLEAESRALLRSLSRPASSAPRAQPEPPERQEPPEQP